MYIINTSEFNKAYNIKIVETSSCIPLDQANSDYQRVLDDIIEQGASCFDGDIPAELQAAADAKLAAKQLAEYTTAIARLAQYVVADGRAEVKEMQATGEQVYNEETMEMDNVMQEVVTVSAIEPLEPTIIHITYSIDTVEPTEEIIENPLITIDTAERVEAQAVIDATPQPIIDKYSITTNQ